MGWWGNNVHVPARTQALHPHHTRAAPSSWFTIGVGWGGGGAITFMYPRAHKHCTTALSLSGGPFWPLSGPNPSKRISPPLPGRTPERGMQGAQATRWEREQLVRSALKNLSCAAAKNGPGERAMSTANQMGSRRAGEVRFEGFGLLSGQNGPPERARSTGKQIKSRRGGEVPFEELGLLNPNTDHQKEQGAQPTRWEREKLGRSVLKDLGRCAAKTDHQKDQGAQPSRSRAEELGRPVLMDLGC